MVRIHGMRTFFCHNKFLGGRKHEVVQGTGGNYM